jgi:SAM-dependent MidA family methyltransferase
MDLALYDPEAGYYARAAQRSGRAGDFFTSVDVGPVFGELIEIQLAEMADIVTTINAEHGQHAEKSIALPALSEVERPALSDVEGPAFDLVEAAAGNGRLAADILTAARRRDPAFYSRIRLHLIETSTAARAAQRLVLGDMAERLASSSPDLPESFSGVLLANELLDALPVHQVVMRPEGLREVYVDASRGALRAIEDAPSTPELGAYFETLGIDLEPGSRAEVNLRACEWIRTAARRLTRGFIIVIDYGHEARELYSPSHAGGTLTTFARHTAAGPELPPDAPAWLEEAGDRDITSHVDFTSVRLAAEAEGLTTVGFLDQTYFLIGLGAANLDVSDLKKRLALKTLLMPGGLGSTHKVLIFGKGVGQPALAGCSYRMRVT